MPGNPSITALTNSTRYNCISFANESWTHCAATCVRWCGGMLCKWCSGYRWCCWRHRCGMKTCTRLTCWWPAWRRSEEHTSELQSLMRISYAVFCLKKTKYHTNKHTHENSHNTYDINS